MIGSLSSSDDSDVGLDVFKTVVGYFKFLNRTMMLIVYRIVMKNKSSE